MTNSGSPPETISNTSENANPFSIKEDGVYFDGAIPSSSKKGVQYHVIVTPTTASCECLAFTRYRIGRDCSHITVVKETIDPPFPNEKATTETA